MVFDVTVVLDKSGSMSSIADDAVGGFNQFLKEQEEGEGEMRVTLVQFDTAYEMVYADEPVAKAPRLSLNGEDGKASYQPGGMTALLDAVGKAINEAKSREQSGHKTLFVVLTDGHENSSHEWSRSGLRDEIERQRKRGWDFLFLGANIDSFAEAKGMGIPWQGAADYVPTGEGVRAAMFSSSSRVSEYRNSGGLRASLTFSNSERNAMAGGSPTGTVSGLDRTLLPSSDPESTAKQISGLKRTVLKSSS